MDSIFFYRNPDGAASGDVPLAGLNIAIQPNLSVAGWPLDAGSRALAHFTALEDATIVDRLSRSGAFLCGSTKMSEFGFGLTQSHAGEAVKQAIAGAELVLDMTGEARLAAAAAGVCGFKPSYGLVSHFGLIGLIPSMEACGVLSPSIQNIRGILKAVAGPDEKDFSLPDEGVPDFAAQAVDPPKTAIGVLAEAQSPLTAEVQGRFRLSVDELRKAGFAVREVSFPEWPLFLTVHKIVGSVEASSAAGRYDSVRYGERAPGAKNWNEMYLASRGAAFGTLLKSFLFQGAFFQFQRYAAYEDACRIRARLVADMKKRSGEVDFLVLPVSGGASDPNPATLDETYRQFAGTAFANVTGQPTLVLPPASAGHAPLQFAGPRLCDAALLSLGEKLLMLRKGGK
jgi:aspartyl-tRNA(Asn)/glutamyl-tRNA(Gln) amidotransferase subunit A